MVIQQLFTCCCKPQRTTEDRRRNDSKGKGIPDPAKGQEGCRWSLTLRRGQSQACRVDGVGVEAALLLHEDSGDTVPLKCREAPSEQSWRVALSPSISEETEAQRGCRRRAGRSRKRGGVQRR